MFISTPYENSPNWATMSLKSLKITYVGHATVLIQMGSFNFLTDPNFSNKVGWRQPRLRPPGLTGYQLPPLEAILVSQANPAHLDLFSFKYFKTNTPVVVPKGLGKLIRRFLPHPVTELEPSGVHPLPQAKLHALPILKKSSRANPFRYNAATAYLLESPEATIYFAGDTGFGDHFSRVGKEFAIDLALLPVQTRNSPTSGPRSSLTPAKAVRAAKDLGAKHWIPIAWDAFSFGKKKPEEIISEIQAIAKKENQLDHLKILQPGESFVNPASLE
jgi:L-ascorbate metabolism protein UlaG (beta-lactamase superfamily)